MKSKTHIYMANLIMDELKTGYLELPQFGKFKVPQELQDAILKYPDAFRAGAVGPDFYPDMLVGQTVIHPENSGKWLEAMFTQFCKISANDPERPKILSFVSGFMMHYAGDLYGHHYVNGWARGWFPSYTEAIADPEKMKKIVRHILVETYMDQKVPAGQPMTVDAPLGFVKECFIDEADVEVYGKSSLLRVFKNLEQDVHKTGQSNSVGMLDVVNYYNSWEADIKKGTMEWLSSWNKIAGALTKDEGGMSEAKAILDGWISNYLLKMTCIPDKIVDVVKKIGEILDELNILKKLKELILKEVEDFFIQMVLTATGIKVKDIQAALKKIEEIFKNPKLYLDAGILYDDKNITQQLDKEMGNYGRSSNTLDQTFEAFYQCLNMCKLCLLGPSNLNALIQKGSGANLSPFKNQICTKMVKSLNVNIKTKKNGFLGTNGTDDNVYFAVILKNGTVYELLFDKPGYNDFESNKEDTYYFELPKRINPADIAAFQLRKDYIKISDDWTPQWINIKDETGTQIHSQSINKTLKGRTPYSMNVDLSRAAEQRGIELDVRVISFLYSLDGKGPNNDNPTAYKQWEAPGFVFYSNPVLREKVYPVLFGLKANN